MSDAIIYRKRLKYLCAWAAFGANTSYLNSTLRAIQTDLHEDNIIQSKGEVVIVDLDDLFWIDYPADWPKICRAYMPLFRWLDSNRTAAFRFGYLQNGGPIGRMVFDRLRSDYGLNAFREMEDVTYEPDIKTSWNRLSEESVEADRRWRELRDKKLRYGNLRTRKLVYTSVGRWIKELERLSEKLRLSEEERQDVEEYYYLKNLCAAYLNGNGGHLCEAILVLYWINRCRLKLITASGYLYLAKNMLGGYFEKCIAYAERVASRDVRDALAHAREGTEFEECMTARLVEAGPRPSPAECGAIPAPTVNPSGPKGTAVAACSPLCRCFSGDPTSADPNPTLFTRSLTQPPAIREQCSQKCGRPSHIGWTLA